jgi:NAD(P)-dependent dehydrogenase (short-subunit alcohol dehydrogenase family)
MADRELTMDSVLVTGCSSGVGLATAVAFARRGHHVFAGVRRPESVPELDAEVAGQSLPLEVVALDVRDQASVDAALSRVHEQVGGLDVLVNNAGISPFAAVEDQPMDEALLTLETNLLGPMRLIQGVVPAMRAQGRGVIVNVSSVSGFISIPFLGIYSASKFGLEALSEALAHEVAGAGIRVALIELGVFDTGIGEKSPAPPPSAALGDRAQAAAQMRLDMARVGPPLSLAADAIVAAATDPATPRRVLVGDDAAMMADLYASQTPSELYDTLHAFYDLP